MRQSADWMTKADERILEVIREEGNMTPQALSREGTTPRIDITRKYAGRRCRKLAKAGLLRKIDRGLFGITERGVAFLDEEFDARELPDPDTDAE
ncbi:hypothetical protein GCM10009017_12550 [Halarchaeum rubridurum]|uniref:Winged helix-turn-helix DNA-binding n=2 Tax=Halarchaeum rubridurum TaxID=489911 RepID=A0A830FUW5_9EURY|nr:hypothetical protein GCM10009017_12550 [Halarchaeum rubridurum]